jgi:hypothetical protein
MNLGPTEQAVKCPSIQLCCCAAAVPLSTTKFTPTSLAAPPLSHSTTRFFLLLFICSNCARVPILAIQRKKEDKNHGSFDISMYINYTWVPVS